MNQSSLLKVLLAVGSVVAAAFGIYTSSSKKKDKPLSPKKLLKLYDKVEHLEDVGWYCDNCNACLNEQRGFSVKKGHWVCRECGTENSLHFFDVINRDN